MDVSISHDPFAPDEPHKTASHSRSKRKTAQDHPKAEKAAESAQETPQSGESD